MATGKVPGYIWELEWCLGTYRQQKVSRNIWALERCPDTYRKQKVA